MPVYLMTLRCGHSYRATFKEKPVKGDVVRCFFCKTDVVVMDVK